MPAISIQGLQKAQADNLKVIYALRPNSALGNAVKYAATAAQRYAVSITHVWKYLGGGLRASHRIRMESGTRGRVYIDPTSVNPRGQRPAEYGIYEHARGGSHAFYERTVDEQGPTIAREAAYGFIRRLP